jgi:hypothetical protein
MKANLRVGATFSSDFCTIKMVTLVNNPPLLNIKFVARAVGAGSALRYGSGSVTTKMSGFLRLRKTDYN